MADFFANYRPELDSPGRDAFSVTPSDSVDLTDVARALYIGVSGDLKITTLGGNDLTFKNVPVGFFPFGAKRVFATGTAASEILAINV